MLLERGYHDLGIQAVLEATATPKGSFYHHFKSKQDFGLACLDLYMSEVHGALDLCLDDSSQPPLRRVRNFFERVQEKYRQEGYLGCLLGGLGQELSALNDVFRAKVEGCFAAIAKRVAICLQEAIELGDLPVDANPDELANLLVNCWEGAALRCRLLRDPVPLGQMIDFYFKAAQSPA